MPASKRALGAAFTNLAKPENNFELVVPDDEAEDDDDVDGNVEMDTRLQQKKEKEERRELARGSEVIKQGCLGLLMLMFLDCLRG